jgi:hypothetical protein
VKAACNLAAWNPTCHQAGIAEEKISMESQDKSLAEVYPGGSAAESFVNRVFEIVKRTIKEIPPSDQIKHSNPELHARVLTKAAALKAAAVSGTLALPPGPWGLMTVLPDLIEIWRLQARLVSDIAAVYGERASLTHETLLYCLFRHAVAQVIRDLVTRVGERIVVQRASWRLGQRILHRVSMEITRRVTGRSVSRLLPLIGALGVAGYAYYDTAQVGQTAIEFFSKEIELK